MVNFFIYHRVHNGNMRCQYVDATGGLLMCCCYIKCPAHDAAAAAAPAAAGVTTIRRDHMDNQSKQSKKWINPLIIINKAIYEMDKAIID